MTAPVSNLAADVVSFTSNAFLVAGETTALVDAGAGFDVVDAVRERVDGLDAVYVTHTHPDHVANVDAVREAFDVETRGFDPDHDAVDDPLADGDRVAIGDHEYDALHTPGHAPDHLCFHAPAAGVLFAGDLVFANGGFGRTDLPGGDEAALVESIERVRDRAGDLRELHAGHGPSVTEDAAQHLTLAVHAAGGV